MMFILIDSASLRICCDPLPEFGTIPFAALSSLTLLALPAVPPFALGPIFYFAAFGFAKKVWYNPMAVSQYGFFEGISSSLPPTPNLIRAVI